MSLYLVIISKRLLPKLAWIAGCALLIFGVVGTASRGASLGMAASLLFLVVKSRRKAIPLFAMLVVAIGLVIYAPSQYFDRLETIQRYTEDSSASGRIIAWKAAIKMAIDHPLGVGAGNFNTAYGRKYRAADAPSMRWISVHSIYFSVLGEYGVIGLIMILSILYLNYRDNVRSGHNNASGDAPDKDAIAWPLYLNMALIAYAVCGIFLGGVGYPHLYILSALTVATRVLSENSGELPSPADGRRKTSRRGSTPALPGVRIRETGKK
jgi:probable O-glycosylation ligase (exosortase A-associated)